MDDRANGMLYTVKDLRRALICMQSEQDEAEGYLEALEDFKYIDRDLLQAIREGYAAKIHNTKQDIEAITENLEDMGYVV